MNSKKMVFVLSMCSLLFANQNLQAQILHHQTFSTQGKNILTSSGFFLSQSIGQNSPSGTFKNSEIVVQQGFQQYAVTKYRLNSVGFTTKVYPNPFVSSLTIEFSHSFNEEVEVTLYDLSGKLIKLSNEKLVGNIMNVNLEDVVDGQYILCLNFGLHKFSTKVIKKNKL
jgi:hypothetical protein